MRVYGCAFCVQGLVFYGVLGIKDLLRPDVKQAVADCHLFGRNVRLVTGPTVNTARRIRIDLIHLTHRHSLGLGARSFARL